MERLADVTSQSYYFKGQWLQHYKDVHCRNYTDMVLQVENGKTFFLHSAVIVPLSSTLGHIDRYVKSEDAIRIILPQIKEDLVPLMIDLVYTGECLINHSDVKPFKQLLNLMGFNSILGSLSSSYLNQSSNNHLWSNFQRNNDSSLSEEAYFNDELYFLSSVNTKDFGFVRESPPAKRSKLRPGFENNNSIVHNKKFLASSTFKADSEKSIVTGGKYAQTDKIIISDKITMARSSPKSRSLSTRYVIHGHNFKKWSIGQENYIEGTTSWVNRKAVEDLMDFVDLTTAEKAFFSLWNWFLIEYKKSVPIAQLHSVLERFVTRWGKELAKRGLQQNLIAHVVNLERSNLISQKIVLEIIKKFWECGK